jgi:hypothetical protein
MLYVVLPTGEPGETGTQDRFFQAQKQAQSFPVGSAGMHFIAGPLWPPHQDVVFTLGPGEPLRSARSHRRRKLDAGWLQR